MNIAEMHVWFRQYAQQMGMQNVRAILPEQIDLLINTSISDIVNQLIKENIGITTDRVATDNSKIGQINALKSLYRVKEIDFLWNSGEIAETGGGGTITKPPILEGEDSITTQAIDDAISGGTTLPDIGSSLIKTLPFVFDKRYAYSGLIKSNSAYTFPEHLFLVDFSINYSRVTKGLNDKGDSAEFDDSFVTNYFPIRLIDDAFLADSLNDFILKNRLRSPILTIYNDNQYDLYIEPFKNVGTKDKPSWVLKDDLLPYQFRMSYIAKPAEVKFGEDYGVKNKDCDLPESLHVDILKHAVDLYRVSVSGSLYASQQQAQAQQQENARNGITQNQYQ